MGRLAKMSRLWLVLVALAIAAVSADVYSGDVVMLEIEKAKGAVDSVAKAEAVVDAAAKKTVTGVKAAAAEKNARKDAAKAVKNAKAKAGAANTKAEQAAA